LPGDEFRRCPLEILLGVTARYRPCVGWSDRVSSEPDEF
jgi:hypothetical protein